MDGMHEKLNFFFFKSKDKKHSTLFININIRSSTKAQLPVANKSNFTEKKLLK